VENQSNSRTKTTQDKLRISLLGDSTLIASYRELAQEYAIIDECAPHKFILEKEHVFCVETDYKFKLPLNPKNFSNSLLLLKRLSPFNKKMLIDKNEKIFLNKWKKSSLPNDKASQFFSLFDELMEVFHKRFKIENLPLSILSLSHFKSYNSCQILLHEKGNISAESYDEKGIKKIIDIKIFQKNYNQIRKSKNKLFSQIPSPKDELEVVGSFLASDFEFQSYSMLLIVSRNEFLRPTISEIDSFEFICVFLRYFFSESLRRERLEKRFDNIKNLISVWDEKIQIIKNNENIFDNSLLNSTQEKHEYTAYNLHENIQLRLYKRHEDMLSPDLQHYQRIVLLGDLLNTLQHELSNPLFGLKLSAEILADDKPCGELKETLIDISQHSERCQSIIKNFSNLYHDKKTFSYCDLIRLVKESMVLAKSEIKDIQKELIVEDNEYWATTNPTWFTQIVFNALLNASQAIKNATLNSRNEKITIHLTKNHLSKTIKIIIEDTGPGISEQNLNMLFSPFFTTKKEGTGLGLSICQNLAHKLDAKVSLNNNTIGKGAVFIFEHPL